MSPFLLIIQFLNFALEVYSWIFTAYILMSWFPIDPYHPIVRFIRGLCEPLYRKLLEILPPLRFGMVDFSVVYVFVLFFILRNLLFWLARIVI